MSADAFPIRPDELTASWLTGALRSCGALAPDESVTGVRTEPVALQGLASLVVRLGLEYLPPRAGPASLIAKLPSTSAEVNVSNQETGASWRESQFYRQMMSEDPIGVVATCYGVHYDRESGYATMLLEDLSDWRTGSVLDPSAHDVEALLIAMAPFHARHWDDARLEEARWLQRSNRRRAESVSGLLAAGLPRCRELFPDKLGPLTATVTELAVADPRVFELLGQGPQTVLHGDLHLQNAMFRNGAVRAIDWQTCFRGNAMADVARLFASSLTIAERRELTEKLLLEYCAALGRFGVTNYPDTQAMDDLAVALIHNVMVYVIALPLVDLAIMKTEEERTGVTYLDATFGRLEAALADHDTLGAVRRRLAAMPAAEG